MAKGLNGGNFGWDDTPLRRGNSKSSGRKMASAMIAKIPLPLTADEPERLRGKQHEKLWADEVAAWRYPEAWDQAQFGLRIGKPQAIVTSTPRPTKIIKSLVSNADCIVTRGTSYDNKDNLAPEFFKSMIRALRRHTLRKAGTQCGTPR